MYLLVTAQHLRGCYAEDTEVVRNVVRYEHPQQICETSCRHRKTPDTLAGIGGFLFLENVICVYNRLLSKDGI